jgi:hypothetical protein
MKAPQPPPEHYILPARQLSFTRDEVLAQTDELILGLTGLRQLVSMHGPKPAEAPPHKLRLVRGFLKVLMLLGDDLPRGIVFGATIETFYQYNWNRPPDRVLPLRAYDTRANTFAIQQAAPGGTPLVVAERTRTLSVVHLKDIVKVGMRQRFEALRAMGMKTVMITGDNPLTAASIAAEAGVDDYLAEAKPDDKMALIPARRAERSAARDP